MTDEKYIFTETERERKRTARGVHNKRSHAGRGGRVKTPSDFLSRKERNKMNGDVNIYKLIGSLSWKEFKMMPDDIQSQYLNGTISKYDPDAITMARVFKTTPETVRRRMKELGIKPKKGGHYDPNRNDAFLAWWHGISTESGGGCRERSRTRQGGRSQDHSRAAGKKACTPVRAHDLMRYIGRDRRDHRKFPWQRVHQM